jgi:HD-like signal output (HDOD) protein
MWCEGAAVPVELGDQLTKDTVLAKVPAFSPVVLKVIDLLSRESVSASNLANAIAGDAALSSQILRLANSALFGNAHHVDTVQKAVVAIGNNWVQHVTLALGASGYVKAAAQSEELKRSWRHAVASAVLSREIARASNLPADRAYAVGLLHDIGRLGLLATFPKEYKHAIQASQDEGVPLAQQERAIFGMDHCELGLVMAKEWNLPEHFSQALVGSHELEESQEIDLPRAVHVACLLADALGFCFVPPVKKFAVDGVLALLPDSARNRLPETSRLVELVVDGITEDETGHVKVEAVQHASKPETPQAELTKVFPKRWIFVLVTAGVMTTVLVLAAFLSHSALFHWHW